ncbi:MAG: Ig-like domain-containing protein [Candidatus Bathyarchaeia archaeon]
MNVRTLGATRKLLAIGVLTMMIVFTQLLNVTAQTAIEYQRYVHTYLNAPGKGNWTYIEKPIFPIYINSSQIPIGQNWTIVCPLEAGHSYHVYCYGAWVHTGSKPKTDYDIYVYNPQGSLESTHTESAGLPEHLGTTVEDPFFVPASSGNYTFVIVNDARESHGADQATFMIIENIECDKWYTHEVKGKTANLPTLRTSWAYEFITDSERIEVWVRVPDTLDMYEARLYLMSNAKSLIVNNISLPWESGLYGNVSDVGGYNLNSEGYRGVAYASCEYNGQDMYLNYTSPSAGQKLYHLVLIGEVGEGTIEFLVKTKFDTTLLPLTFPHKVTPADTTEIAYMANTTELENATLRYTVNNWKNANTIEMTVSNRTCNATIPQQPAGSFVEYIVQATDTIKNQLIATGNFTVKLPTAITDFNVTRMKITLGENITATGTLSAEAAGAPVTVTFMSINATEKVQGKALENGTFTISYQPTTTGTWLVQASFAGNATLYECESITIMVTVQEPSFLSLYGLYIGGGLGGGLGAAGAIVYIKKYRE